MKTQSTTTLLIHRRNSAAWQSGVALLITLLMLSLLTIVAVALLGTMSWEKSAARNNYENQGARSLATLGMNNAVAQIRQALGPWDNPYANFAVNPPATYWSMSPGIISSWSYTSTTPATNYPLFSIGTTNLVNLNAATSDGSYPIAGGATPPDISVYWVNILKNPATTTASASNPIVGRYAFWVDDENAKINVNTADGTMKYQTNSLGLGTPSEVSLQALQQGGANIPVNVATNIVYLARTAGLNSPKEILRASGSTPDLYTNNVFNLTAYSRSPDLNIFGQPKMALMPILGDSDSYAVNMAINAITLQPSKEIYPTPSQLPAYSVTNPINANYLQDVGSNPYWIPWYPPTPPAPNSVPWPLAFRGNSGVLQNGLSSIGLQANGAAYYTAPNFAWVNGMILANYLAGTNAAGQAINWPVFPVTGSSTTGFSGKYTPRQIDSIVAQILSLGQKEISPDYFYNTISDWGQTTGYRGLRVITTPPVLFGWLSHQWVIGMGRTPKLDAMEIVFTTQGSVLHPTDTGYVPPTTSMDIKQEWWLPASYLGGNNVIPINDPYEGSIHFGVALEPGVLNTGDLSANYYPYNGAPTPPLPDYFWPPAPLPKSPADSSGSTKSYWGNQLLSNNQGMDFQGNPNDLVDPDQLLAGQYHAPYAWNATLGTYMGTGLQSYNGSAFATPFELVALQPTAPGQDWAPGEMRCVQGSYTDLIPMDMQTNAGTAANPTLTIGGGIQVRAEMESQVTSDPDPIPLESIRGEAPGGSVSSSGNELYDGELWTNSPPAASVPGSPAGTTVQSRNMASVIPISFSMPIPGNSTDGSIPGNTEYVLTKVQDPLVAEFPGDWTPGGGATVTYSSSAPTAPGYWASTTDTSYATSTEYATTFHNGLTDPDSYWLPQADCGISLLGDIASQTLIPRSARMPNIGYLQYLRTGIIPDDETQPYQTQHGTPFRLLSYAPLTDMANQKTTRSGSQAYPDWALLDLLYVPSILAPYGGPYGYYDTNSPPVWQGYGNPTVLSSYSTGGGSTPGRINPNGMVIYTTNSTTPQPGVCRSVPMQAMLQNLMVNQTLNSGNLPSPTPGLTGGTAVDYSYSSSDSDPNSIPNAIENYLRASGPLRMPSELCEVPAIAALRPSVNATRNDLIRQIVGNLTTQTDTFSVWVAGQSIFKSKANTNYGIYEPGDQVSASVRYHFIVERYLDPGADGVYGNSVNGGADGIPGTYDDPVDSNNHPFEPRYLYRIVSAEEIR